MPPHTQLHAARQPAPTGRCYAASCRTRQPQRRWQCGATRDQRDGEAIAQPPAMQRPSRRQALSIIFMPSLLGGGLVETPPVAGTCATCIGVVDGTLAR